MRFASRPAATELAEARCLVLQHGWNTTCYQILNTGITRWFSDDSTAVIGFVERNRVRVVAGAPVCSPERIAEVMAAFEAQARSDGLTVCYFGAEARAQAASESGLYSRVVLGAQPIWTPAEWIGRVHRHKSFRAQLARAQNKGVVVSEWHAERAERSPDLRRLLTEWLTTRGLPAMHFLVEPQTLDNLEGRRIFVASRTGTPVGFLVLSPIPERAGWLTEQFVRGFSAPNGTVELLVDAGVCAIGRAGAEYVTMGIVPLSSHGSAVSVVNPPWLRLLLKWVRAHGRRFYNFDGLDAFKSKFQPERWEAIYAISNESKFSFRTLRAIGSAFSDGPVAWSLARAMTKAARQELAWMTPKKAPSTAQPNPETQNAARAQN